MSYLLITGLIFIGVPVFVIIAISLIITINFARDDGDAKALLNFALMSIGLGIVFVLAHFATSAFK
ncbi:hypothetical protein COY25_02490 [Candidatus Uhrbacteria bacterium CG_4_10_14_0_2_um_filter_41_7]|uniref:Uncharacterized protein n=1 Tax=Candidatus Uhrbacteria bacterium CG_4_9_14_3_um_filter_41_35 TaxID=1975034 RepID=A0A2M7XED3_9BACT|nr:MAG: hypothetical protein COV92_00405 [Candidatus Uhrbacteria bacterium CG11_big_fil_rev_8_21_14_0_20_41_9]PIZ54146.1 MAG: hypothetical protein COY25_02490 [Candidatus Uhrbacteria bacterium CG_4_10_14_0_2_um_filter_41_7]PJA46066.1 MAG: hypothetical protein CO173_03765 [Candidatus Uhrbacteria bacterium CG_4_9_14_3_um_filter_41_35]